MFVQTVLEEIKIKAEFPTFRFLFMFTGVVGAALLATGESDFTSIGQSLPLALLLLSSIALNGERLQLKATRLSPALANRRT